ncbi:MAG: phage tail sheath protein, partial [Planctomycetota bacterium]
MTEMILPGTYIEVRDEGLIVAGRISVGNLGVVGTASKGKIEEPVLLSRYDEATEVFGDYDPFIDGKSDELTLVRALEQAYKQGAKKVYAVRVTGKSGSATTAAKSQITLQSSTGPCVKLTGLTAGTWANEIGVNVADAEENAFIESEDVPDATGTRTL